MFLHIIFTFALFFSLTIAKVNLRHSAINKKFISHLEIGEYEIVHPFQVRDKSERIGIDTRNPLLNGTVHYQHATLVLKAPTLIGGRLKLTLKLNDYLFFNETKFNKLDADGEAPINERIENCYYQGTVNGDATTFVALSTCNGLRGIIAFENGTSYGLWPLDGGDKNRRHPHVLYKTSWNKEHACGAVTQNLESQFRFLKKRDVTRQTKYVELAVIGDHKFVHDFSLKVEEAVYYLLEAINIADYILVRDLNVRLSVVYLEVWMDSERVDIHPDIERSLAGTHDYVTGHIYHIAKDATIMVTTASFASQDAVSSMFSSVCTSRAVGLVKAVDSNTVHGTAQFVSHAVGHVLGIDHDSPDCLCANHRSCVMDRKQSSPDSDFLWQFSKCSVARMHSVLQSGHVQCLLNRPFQESRLHQCGNGVVDGDEECDCGPRNECFDPCCDPLTCTLRAHAQCASHQACCHRCELRKAGTICRESRSFCDVPEFCDGESGDCPLDGYLVDGIGCGIQGHCWKGNCSDPEQQCKELWGTRARASEEACYDYNLKGLEYGNCGRDRNGEFKVCEPINKKCGTLHCQDGASIPLESSLSSFSFQFLVMGKQVQCKAITNPEFSMVVDGTSCGAGSICIEGSCLPLVQVSPPVHCPSNNLALQCSGRGDCTTTQKCICYDGWTGLACDIRSNTSRRLMFSTPSSADVMLPSLSGRTIETTTLLMILLIVGVFLLLLLVCLLFFYRRRSSADYSAPMVVEKLDESFHDDGNRAIKFGNMPSYRDEKRKHKKNKRIYDALHKINEVDERETASLKSRESASVISAPTHIGETIVLAEARESAAGGILKNNYIHRYYESTPDNIYAESVLNHTYRRPCSPAQSDFCRRQTPKLSSIDMINGYATDSDIPHTGYGLSMLSTYDEDDEVCSQLSSQGRSVTTRLSNLQMLLNKLPESLDRTDGISEHDLRVSNESFERRDPEPIGDKHPNDHGLPDPPPASADSGLPSSIYDTRSSPTLFSDPFRLDGPTMSS